MYTPKTPQKRRTAGAYTTSRRHNRKRPGTPSGMWLFLVLPALVLVIAFSWNIYNLTYVSKSEPPFVVAIDAGHGGHDPGSIGLIPEVELTERTADYLYNLLAADENYTPFLCRNAGEYEEIQSRTFKAQMARASLLISIHGNSDDDPATNGFECFPVPPGRTHHKASLGFAELVSAQMASSGATLRGYGGIRYAYYEKKDSGSQEKIFREATDTSVYTEKSFGILEGASCPAILAEQCFITSESDMEMFGYEAGCLLAAESYYRAICEYYETAPLL